MPWLIFQTQIFGLVLDLSASATTPFATDDQCKSTNNSLTENLSTQPIIELRENVRESTSDKLRDDNSQDTTPSNIAVKGKLHNFPMGRRLSTEHFVDELINLITTCIDLKSGPDSSVSSGNCTDCEQAITSANFQYFDLDLYEEKRQ